MRSPGQSYIMNLCLKKGKILFKKIFLCICLFHLYVCALHMCGKYLWRPEESVGMPWKMEGKVPENNQKQYQLEEMWPQKEGANQTKLTWLVFLKGPTKSVDHREYRWSQQHPSCDEGPKGGGVRTQLNINKGGKSQTVEASMYRILISVYS